MQRNDAPNRLARRGFLKLAAATGGLTLLAACSPASPAATGAPAATTKATAAATQAAATAAGCASCAGVKGGVLRVAAIGEPPSLDPHWTTADVTANIVWHMVEALFSLDEKRQPIPMLAEGVETSNNGLTRTVKLRKGVKFHNGKEMGAEDVEASLRRWSQLSGIGKGLFAKVEALEKPDQHTLVFKMKSPYAIFEAALGWRSQGAAIMPKEIVEKATEKNQITEVVGTGPYIFVEHMKDRNLTVKRWDGYVSNGDVVRGPGGKKNAYFDEIRFIPVPDQSVRISGIQAGEYDYADGINTDQYSLLKDNPAVVTLVSDPAKNPLHYFNMKSPVMGDVKLRQAIMMGIDPEAILKAAWTNTEFYRVSGALMQKEGVWYTETGIKGYNEKNVEGAKALIKESNYKGEPIRYLTSRQYPTMFQESVVLGQQMQNLGLNIDLQVIDWATLVSRRAKPEEWDIFATFHGFQQDPLMMNWNSPTYPGWWDNPQINALRDELLTTIDQQKRVEVFTRLQTLFYEQVPLLKLGDVRDLYLTGPKVKNVGTLPYAHFWNGYFAK